MKRVLFVFLIVGLLLVSNLTIVPAVKINVSNIYNDEVDLTCEFFYGWWSPAPMFEWGEYACAAFGLTNLGGYYEGDYEITVSIYKINSDLTENKTAENVIRGHDILTGSFNHLHSHCRIDSEEPINWRIEINSDIQESNLSNNIITVPNQLGVTIEGHVYKQELNGENTPQKYALIKYDSDVYSKYLYFATNSDGHYCLKLPKNPNLGPYEYTINVTTTGINPKTQEKVTEPLDGFGYTQLDFIFKAKSRGVHYMLLDLIFNLFKRNPLFYRLFGIY